MLAKWPVAALNICNVCINTPHYGDIDTTVEQLQRARTEPDVAIKTLQDKEDEALKHFGD